MGRGIRGNPTGEFPKEFCGRSQIPLKGQLSKTKIAVMPGGRAQASEGRGIQEKTFL